MIRNTCRGTAGIAALAVRNTVRSKLFISLAVLLIFTIAFLPLSVKGDGSVEGKIRIILSYTLGFSSILLGAATLWAGCGSVSQEIGDRHIGLMVVKPVYRFQVWLGKWIGLLFVDLVLLSIVGAMVYVLLLWTISPSKIPDSQNYKLHRDLLVGREIVRPRDKGVEKKAQKIVDRLLAAGEIKKEEAMQQFLVLKAQLTTESVTVPAGTVKQWHFKMPEVKGGREKVTVDFSFSSFYRNRNPVNGVWIVGREGAPDMFRYPVEGLISGPHMFELPKGICSVDQDLILTFMNQGKSLKETAVFETVDGIMVAVRKSGFGSNYWRALLVIFCQMAILAALGLTAGTLFFFPVAVFTGVSVLLTAMLSHFYVTSSFFASGNEFEQLIGQAPTIMEKWGIWVSDTVDFFVGPVMSIDAIELLASGIYVSWSVVLRAILLMLIAYPLLMGCFGAYVLKRRELALPAE